MDPAGVTARNENDAHAAQLLVGAPRHKGALPERGGWGKNAAQLLVGAPRHKGALLERGGWEGCRHSRRVWQQRREGDSFAFRCRSCLLVGMPAAGGEC